MKILLTFAHPLLIGNFFPTVIEHKLEDTEKIPGVLPNGIYDNYPVYTINNIPRLPRILERKPSKFIPQSSKRHI